MSSEETQNTAAGSGTATTPGQEAYEEEHVHSVYEQIASHFSSTRYKVGIVHDASLSLHRKHPLQSHFLKERINKKISESQNSRLPSFLPIIVDSPSIPKIQNTNNTRPNN
jgi:hypothetical protein